LLLKLDNQFKDVAKGNILMPLSRQYHGNPMPDSVHRVQVAHVLPFCHEWDPPNQPANAESELKIKQLKNHILLSPKALICLNTALRSEASQERVTPPVASAALSQGKVALPSMPEAREERPDTPPAYDPPEHDGAMDIDQAPIDTFIADLEADDAPRHVPDQGRGPLAKKLMFSSQETLEEQAAAITAPPQSMISPKALFILTKEEMQQKGTLICNKKKERKRKQKGEAASTSMRPVAWVLDRLSTPWRKMHFLGEPVLPSEILKDMGGSIKDVHEIIMYLEDQLLREKNPGYPVHVVKVPTNVGFVDVYPGDLFFIRFKDIFMLLYMFWMDKSLAHDIIVERRGKIVIMDPFYMDELFLSAPRNRAIVSKYIEDFMVANKDKDCFLMPYFPE
jgi:hypothetical protein